MRKKTNNLYCFVVFPSSSLLQSCSPSIEKGRKGKHNVERGQGRRKRSRGVTRDRSKGESNNTTVTVTSFQHLLSPAPTIVCGRTGTHDSVQMCIKYSASPSVTRAKPYENQPKLGGALSRACPPVTAPYTGQ